MKTHQTITTTTCDRCGFHVTQDTNEDPTIWDWNTLIIKRNHTSTTYHLCPTCDKDLKLWFEVKKT